jgi:ABC-type lipoprotein release transport system permease subunit
MRWLMSLAIRNVFRNKRRTALTTFTVLLGTALLTLGLSWLNGVLGMILGGATDMAGEVRVVTPGYSLREASFPLYENMDPVEPVTSSIEAAVEGADAYPLIKSGVTLTVGEEIGDHFGLLVAAQPAYFREIMALDQGIEQGAYFSGEKGEALLGRVLAGQLEAQVGDELVVLGQTQDGSPSPLKLTVQGIVNGGNSLADRQVYVDLSMGQWLADMGEGATEILVYGEGFFGASEMAATLRATEGLQGLEVQAWNEREPYSGIYATVSTIFGVLAFIIVFVTALGVLNTMIMSVMERSAEVGVLRAMGLRKRGVVAMFLMEGLLIGVAGAVAGLGLGMIPAMYLETHGVTLGEGLTSKTGFPLASTIHANFTWGIACLSVSLGVLTAVLGSLIPAMRAAAIQPVNAMRRRR